MSNATDVINYFRGVRDSHKGGPYIDWEEFDALAESHAELLGAMERISIEMCLHADAKEGGTKVRYCLDLADAAIAKAKGEAP